MLKNFFCVVTISLILLITALPIQAAMTLGEYQKINKSDMNQIKVIQLLLTGVGEGFMWANATLANENLKMLYCQPEIGLSGVNLQSILDNEIKQVSYRPDAPLSYILLKGLESVFPCKESASQRDRK